jgi:hypothetical protein
VKVPPRFGVAMAAGLTAWLIAAVVTGRGSASGQPVAADAAPAIPEFWSTELLEDYELPLATPARTPQHVSRDYYYALPERRVYQSYPVYHPDREPTGYMDRLRAAEPEVVFDATRLHTDADWIAAGRLVFELPIDLNGPILRPAQVRDRAWYARHRVSVAADGTMPYARWIVREKGKVELGNTACAMCHTRVMPDGTTIPGAQGNFPFDGIFADDVLALPPPVVPLLVQVLLGAPWDVAGSARLRAMSRPELRDAWAAIPPGVIARQGTSLFAPPAVPDLIGIADRRYLDKTGLGRHRDIADLMRYAAMNQTLDVLGDYGGFVPDAEDGRTRAAPGKAGFSGANDRYSDAQLYALARFLYSLTPPPNPNRPSALTGRGEQVFARSGCARCHTPPAYTANKLVPADGFTVPPEHRRRYDVLDVGVGTDPTLTMRTRRGTGYYKIPSLRGVWYRGPFEHNGSVATLEDWFDPRRLRSDYVPTGFKGAGVAARAVPGHRFGLTLSADDKAALIAFLKTL